jgi:serine/threonine protein kinase
VKWLSDAVVRHLCEITDLPDLTGTKYELVEKIGQGGMASVYLARDRELNRAVALKVLSEPAPRPDGEVRLEREARIIARLEHPGIVPIHDSGILPDGRNFYVMKLVRGQRLDEYAPSATGMRDRLRIFEKICEAIAFAHAQRVIHRDLKPENIMVGAFGEVLVMDWGVAKLLDDGLDGDPLSAAGSCRRSNGETAGSATAHGTIVGTPGYMAPEQARGEMHRLDERTDIYALGGILYFLLTANCPRPAPDSPVPNGKKVEPLRRYCRSIPRSLEAICLKALAADPDGRYPTVQAFADDIARFLAEERVEAYPEGILETAGRLISKYRMAVVLVLAYVAMRILLLFLVGN